MITYQKKKKRKKEQGINPILFQSTNFKDHTFSHLIDYSISTFLFIKKKKCETRYSIYFTVTQLSHQRKQKRQREKEHSRERGRRPVEIKSRRKEKAGKDRRSPSNSTSSASPPLLFLLPTVRLGQIGLSFFFFFFFLFFSFLVLIQLCCYNKNVFIL